MGPRLRARPLPRTRAAPSGLNGPPVNRRSQRAQPHQRHCRAGRSHIGRHGRRADAALGLVMYGTTAPALIGNVLCDRGLRCPADDWGRMPVVCGIGTFWMGNAVLDWRPPVPYRCRGGPVPAGGGRGRCGARRLTPPTDAASRKRPQAPDDPGQPSPTDSHNFTKVRASRLQTGTCAEIPRGRLPRSRANITYR